MISRKTYKSTSNHGQIYPLDLCNVPIVSLSTNKQ